MKRSIIVSILLLLASTAFAKDIKVPKTDISVYAPDPPEYKLEGDDTLLVAQRTDEVCSFLWTHVDGKDLDKALAGLDVLMGKLVTDIKQGKAGKSTINGMKTLILSGTGKKADNGKAISLMMLLVQTSANQVMIVVGGFETAKKDSCKAVADKVFGGIRKAK
jgi:hypothetical protein